jgi:hypothetical protein
MTMLGAAVMSKFEQQPVQSSASVLRAGIPIATTDGGGVVFAGRPRMSGPVLSAHQILWNLHADDTWPRVVRFGAARRRQTRGRRENE